MTENALTPLATAEPLFTLNLADNGGFFAPNTLEQVSAWINLELSFWSWIRSRSFGNHDQGIKLGLQELDQAISDSQRAPQYKDANPQQYQAHISGISTHVQNAFVQHKLPHSTTPVAKRIEAYRKEASDQAGCFFAAIFTPPPQGHHFQPQDLAGWRGMIEGLVDRFNLTNAPLKGRKVAAEQSFEQLRGKVETLLGDKTISYDALHRDYEGVAENIHTAASNQTTNFNSDQKTRDDEFQKLVNDHKTEMEQLRKTFREEIALRAPAEYWETKRKGHVTTAWITGGLTFGALSGAATLLSIFIHDILGKTPLNTAPESWKVAVLVLVGVFTVWGVRLLVRIFLSHLHLTTDAAERVVMVRTYLSLLEGDRLSGDDDRKLILQALFRPATDGIVKDEGLPPSMFEFLTRQSR
jgi:hypothetical protein